MNLRILGPNKIMKIIIIIIIFGYIAPCENVNQCNTQRPRVIIHYNLPINMYFNHDLHITRKRWNKLMKMRNGNHMTNNNKINIKVILSTW